MATKKKTYEEFKAALLSGGDIAPTGTSQPIAEKIYSHQAQQAAEAEKNAGLVKGSDLWGDGYQVGDVIGTIFGTVGDIGLGVVQGAANVVEGVADLGIHGVGAVGGMFGAKDFAADMKDLANANSVDDMFGMWKQETGIEGASVLGGFCDSLAQGVGQVGAMILTGGTAQALGAGSGAVSAVTHGTMAASSLGSGISEAYAGGATDAEAWTYGLIKAGVDTVSEMFAGGLGKVLNIIGVGKGLGGVDDMLARKISSKITSQVEKAMAEFRIKATAEGVEELLAGLGTALAKKATYLSEEELGKLVEDEKLLEQFISGAVVSAIAQVPDVARAVKSGRSIVSNTTKNEDAVVNKEYERLVSEAENNGKKLSGFDKSKLYDKALSNMDRGRISIDTIESALGGEDYKKYSKYVNAEERLKRSAQKLRSEYDELMKVKTGELTGEQTERLKTLRDRLDHHDKQLAKVRNSTERKALKETLSNNAAKLAKDSRFAESYAEVARRGVRFKIDPKKLNSYSNAKKKTYESAIAANFNDQNAVHDIVDAAANIADKTGVPIVFKNTEGLAKLGFTVGSGKSLNGVYSDGKVYVNYESRRALNTIVGHEITHSLEGTEHYQKLQDALFKYAKSKKDYDGRRASLEEAYKGKEGVNIDEELAADLVGDYLFTDENFINHLVKTDHSIAKAVFEEIKHLLKLVTAGSDEERALEKAKHAFEKAFNEVSKNAKTGTTADAKKVTKYSLSESKIPTRSELDSKPPMNVVDISTPQTQGSFSERRKQILKNAEEVISKPYFNKDTETMIFLTPKSYTHAFHNAGEIQLNAAEHLPELIENAVLTHSEKASHGDTHADGVYTFFSAVKYGQVLPVKLKVKEYTYSGQELPKNIKEYFDNSPQGYASSYDTVVLEVEEIEKSSVGSVEDIDQNDLFLDPSELSTISIADLLNLVKGKSEEYIPKYSLNAETDGDKVSASKEINGKQYDVVDGVAVSTEVSKVMQSEEYKKPSDYMDKYSISTTPDWEKSYLARHHDEKDLEVVEAIRSFTDKMVQDDAVRGYVPNGDYKYSGMGPLRSNVEYIVTFDMDTSCPRTFQFLNFRDAIQRKAGRYLTYNESINLLELMRAYGQQIPCCYCYVENKRVLLSASYNNFFAYRDAVLNAKTDADAEKAMYGYSDKKGLPDASRKALERWRSDTSYNPSVTDVWTATNTARNSVLNYLDAQMEAGVIDANTAQTKLNRMVRSNFGITDKAAGAEIRGFVKDWAYDKLAGIPHIYSIENNTDVSSVDERALSLNHEALAYSKSASSAKSVENYVPYTDQLKKISEKDRAYIIGMGGIRKHSSNDFRMDYVQDYFLFYADLAANKWTGHTYTKSADFAKIFACTKDRINMSVAFYEDADGTIRENIDEGASWKDVREIRKAYENVGSMAMVTSDNQLSYALNSDWVDMIIPFHASGLDKSVWYNLRMWNDYTTKQSERFFNSDTMRQKLSDAGVEVPRGASADTVRSLYEKTFEPRRIYGKNGDVLKPHFFPGDTYVNGQLVPGHYNDVEEYFRLCEEFGVYPRFHGITVTDTNGQQIDVTEHPSYIKLIKETARTDSLQEAIEFNFGNYDNYLKMTPFEYAMQRLQEEANNGGFENTKADPYGVVEEFNKEYLGKDRPLGYLTDRAKRTRDILLEMSRESAAKQAEIVDKEANAFSISNANETQKRYGDYNVYGKDAVVGAPLYEDIAPYAPTNSNNGTVPNVAEEATEEELAPTAQANEDIGPVANSTGTEGEGIAKVKVGDNPIERKKGSGFNKARTHIFDDQSVIEDLALKTGNRELDAKANYIRTSEQRAQRLIGNGADGVRALTDIRNDVNSSGLTQEFYDYMHHMHNVDRMSLADNGLGENKAVFGDDVTADISRAKAAELESKHPQFKKWAQDVYDFNNYLRQLLVNAGVISQETADLWAKTYPHYVPIRREGKNGNAVNVPLDSGRTGVNAPIKGARGGNSNIEDMFQTMAMRAEQTYRAIAKNNFGIELKNTLQSASESGGVTLNEMIDTIGNDDAIVKKGENGSLPTFTVFENGKRVIFEITEDLYEALKPTNDLFSGTNKVLNTMSKIQRGLLTEYNPAFWFSNSFKDTQDVLMNSQHAARTYATYPEAIKELFSHTRGKDGKWIKEYLDNGGEGLTHFNPKTKTFEDSDSSWFKKVVGFVPEKISQINNFIERVPRVAEYIASRKMGKSIEGAMLDAARVTTNFAAGGDVTKWANRNGFTFLNASVQGFNQFGRNFREAKRKGVGGALTLAAKFAVAGLPALLINSLLWGDDDEYEELSDYVKDNYYIVGKYGDGQFVRIPKGRALAVIQNAFEQMKDQITGDDEIDIGRFTELLVNNIAPVNPLENNVIAPIMQAHSNMTWYGDELVPQRLQDLPAEEQYDETTDELSKWLGDVFNQSPYKINYTLDQYSGAIGDVLLPMMTPKAEAGDSSVLGKIIAPLRDKFTTDSTLKNQNVTDFYDTVDELKKSANSMYSKEEDTLKYKYMSSVNSEISDLYKKKRELQNSNLPDAEKYEAVRKVQREIDDLAKNALDNYNNVNIDGIHATVGDQQYKWNDSEKDPGWKKLDEKQIATQDLFTSALGVSASDYWEYSTDLSDIKSDEDAYGDTISGSRKKKVLEYIGNLDIDIGAKLILYKNEYNGDDNYNEYIVSYLNSRNDLKYDDRLAILKKIGFNVTDDGSKVYW